MNDRCHKIPAEHLGRLPAGFPLSDTGAETKALKRIFSPEEAALAVHLVLDREPLSVIADRAGATGW